MQYGGTNVSLLNGAGSLSDTSASSPSFGESGGYGALGTVVSTAFNIWSSVDIANTNRKMQQDVVKFNNRMRAIQQSVKQYTADKNRIAAGDQYVNEGIQISLDRMRAQSQVAVEGAFLGSSRSAVNAANYDINRNAAQAKFQRDEGYENALQQIQLQEYGDEMTALQSWQNPSNVAPADNVTPVLAGVGGLVQKSVESGAWEKGTKLNTFFTNLFGGGSEVRLPSSS